MKLRRNKHPWPICAARAENAQDPESWLPLGRLLLAAMMIWLASASGAHAAAGADQAAAEAQKMRRIDILLDPTGLPAADLAASEDRLQAIAEARASSLPLFRSFDPRETLRETLAMLEEVGVDVGPSAIINFDSLEAWMPIATKRKLAQFPFVKRIRKPVAPISAGDWDSEGIELTGADLAHAGATAPPVNGAGVTVAIIDRDYEVLTTVINDPWDELYSISTATDMFEQTTSGSSTFNNADLNTKGDREHGTASAEVIYEMAPLATIKLYRVKSTAGITHAIRHAADQGFDIIHVPLTYFETMMDPVGVLAGGGNLFTDDIDYAVALGSIVIVAAGNEAKRHLNAEYLPCAECVDGHPDYLCTDPGKSNPDFHKFVGDLGDELALNGIIFDDDHYDAEVFDITCWSAIEAGASTTRFKVRLHEYDDGSDNDEPSCPGDDGATNVNNTEKNLGGGVPITKQISLFDGDFDEHYFYLSVRDSQHGDPLPDPPNFRIACGTGIEEFYFATAPGSLSDLAVVESAITVAEIDAFYEEEPTETSSRGPTPSGSQKPDVGGPGIVENFTVQEFDFTWDGTFNGTSAASAHVAGIAALLQDYRAQNGMAPLTPAEMKAWLTRSAIDIVFDPGDEGFDDNTGHGLVQVPVSIFEGDVGPLDFYSVTPCRIVDTRFDPGPDGPPAPLTAGVERVHTAAGICGIPTSARAISGILSVVNPSAAGFVTLFPGDELRPGVSAVNFLVGGVTNNNIFLKLASNGAGTFRSYTPTGTNDLIFDVNGYFAE